MAEQKINENDKNKKGDKLEILEDLDGKKYSKDSLVSGIYRFVSFSDNSQGILVGPDGKVIENNPLKPGEFKQNTNIWDIRAACKYLENTATPETRHICATEVRSAIDIGFNTNPKGPNSFTGRAGRPSWAWKYIDFLPNIGFKFLGKVSKDNMKSWVGEPGDIAVYQKNENPSVPGHICMWTGSRWLSDFKQNNMIVYPKTPFAYLFRYAQPR